MSEFMGCEFDPRWFDDPESYVQMAQAVLGWREVPGMDGFVCNPGQVGRKETTVNVLSASILALAAGIAVGLATCRKGK